MSPGDFVPDEPIRVCPICGDPMEKKRKGGIVADVCREHGVWLDRFELERLQGRATRSHVRSVRQAMSKGKQKGRWEGILLGWFSLLLD